MLSRFAVAYENFIPRNDLTNRAGNLFALGKGSCYPPIQIAGNSFWPHGPMSSGTSPHGYTGHTAVFVTLPSLPAYLLNEARSYAHSAF